MGIFINDTLIIASLLLPGILVLALWIRHQFNVLKGPLLQSLLEHLTENKQQQLMQMVEMQNKLTERVGELQSVQERRIGELSNHLSDRLNMSNEVLQAGLNKHRESFDARQLESLKTQQENLTQGMSEVRQQVTEALVQNGEELGKRVDA